MTTISGTAQSLSGTVTLADLADQAQTAVADSAASTWSQADVEQFIRRAIKDYSQHFPRKATTDITAVANQNAYDLPENVQGILSVEYPADEDPPQYLKRKSYTHPDFWQSAYYYDVIGIDDATDYNQLWISDDPDGDETITIWYTADHQHASLAANDTVTVPERHHELLITYAIWQAWIELLAEEQQSPTSNSSLLMAQYASNANRIKRQYQEILTRAKREASGKSGRVQWEVDKYDRIY